MRRRPVLAALAAAGASLLVGSRPQQRVLVLGGTRFVGRHIVAAALAAGHRVTLFNRGRTAPGLFAAAEELHGDRGGDLEVLRGRRWDVVVDTSGTEAGHVRRSAELLASAASRYVFVSSIAVYRAGGAAEYAEEASLRPSAGERSYGEHKLAGELAVTRWFGARATIVRPAVLVGPHDPYDRFVRWPLRAREGGDMLVPGAPDDVVPLADARDLAAWVVRILAAEIGGIYNVAGAGLTMEALIAGCLRRAGASVVPTWIDAAWLKPRELDFGDVPPLLKPAYQRCSSARATARGLRFRGLDATLGDTLAWWDAERPRGLRDLARERERELLAEWHARGPEGLGERLR